MNDNDHLTGTVLVAEDHSPTAHLVELAFEEAAPGIDTELVETGQQAIERLDSVSDGEARPDLVLLDLDLPIKSGYEVLEWRNQFDSLGRIPVVVVSGTSANTAVSQCYDLNAQSYITKPEDWDGFLELATVLVEYWFRHSEDPPVRPGPGFTPVEVESKHR